MKKNKTIYNQIIIISIILSFIYGINFENIVQIEINKDRNNYRLGEYLKLTIDVIVAKDYHIYSSDTLISPPGGETYIEYYDSLIIAKVGNLEEPLPITKFDKNFDQETSYHEGNFSFPQIINLDKGNFFVVDSIIKSNDIYQIEATLITTACDPMQCVRIQKDFTIDLDIESGKAQDIYKNILFESELSSHTSKGFISCSIFAFGMGFL